MRIVVSWAIIAILLGVLWVYLAPLFPKIGKFAERSMKPFKNKGENETE